MKFTTNFEQQSQATRLRENAPIRGTLQSKDGSLTLSATPFQEIYLCNATGVVSRGHNSVQCTD